MTSERLAVTGLGVVSTLGDDAERTFAALVAGARGLAALSSFEVGDVRSTRVAEVAGLDLERARGLVGARHVSRTDALALLSADEALRQAQLPRTAALGIVLGGTTGGMFETEAMLSSPDLARLSRERSEELLMYPLSASLERVAELAGGARLTRSVCSACSGGAIALVQAAAWLAQGAVDAVLAGGADGLCRLTLLGFNSLGATDPEACRPFDRRRAGLNLGEGGASLVLERESSAKQRGARILAYLDGYAVSAEAHHITQPDASGEPAEQTMRAAIARAGLRPEDISYVNAHGTGTLQNDAMEATALLRLFGESEHAPLVSSSKGQLGHTLGAAGALEAAVTVLALVHGVAPPTGGLEEPEQAGLRHVLEQGRAAPLTHAISSSFGFGGMSCVLAFAREDSAAPHPQLIAARRRERPVITFAHSLSVADPLSLVSAERSRRFDRGSALAAACAERALLELPADESDVGLVVGNAFGNVERTMAFLSRAREKGPRFANPAEFPHLVPSAAAGNASIYAGLRGPVFAVSARGQSGEAAVAAACDLIELGVAERVIGGAVAAHDAIVERFFSPARDQVAPTSEADIDHRGMAQAAFLLVEAESAARARGAPRMAELAFRFQGELARAPLPPPARNARLLACASTTAEAFVAKSSWSDVPRGSLPSALPDASAALALRNAFELLFYEPELHEVLVVSGDARRGGLFLLRRLSPGSPA